MRRRTGTLAVVVLGVLLRVVTAAAQPCEDWDHDALCRAADNCPERANADQADGIGDTCDNCPSLPNPDRSNGDYNAIGDLWRLGRTSWRFDIKRGLGRAVGPAPGLAKGARGRRRELWRPRVGSRR